MSEFFQQPKITGYRQLSAQEAELMNQVKAAGEQMKSLISTLEHYLGQQKANATGTEVERINQAQPMKWVAVGKTDLQTGLMALTRAVAQPGAF